MRFGVCGGTGRLAAIRAAGADYVEPAVIHDAVPESPRSEWREKLEVILDSGLVAESWNCWLPSDLVVVGPAADWERYRRYTEEAVSRLAEVGASVVVMGSGRSRTIPDGYSTERGLADFARAVRMAAEAAPDITFAVEPLHRGETNLLNTVAETAAFARSVGLPNVRVTADLYHMETENEAATVVELVAPMTGHAHLADTEREAPGTGTAPIAGFLAALRRAGYDGRVSIECSWQDFDAQVGPALRFLKDTWQTVLLGA